MQGECRSLCGKPAVAELAVVDALWASTFAVPQRQRARWLSQQRVRVVRVNGVVRGACTVSLVRLATDQGLRRCVWLRALAVQADARGEGLAGVLVQHVVRQACAVGLPVALRSPVRGLYARVGLQPVGRVYGLQVQVPALAVQPSATPRVVAETPLSSAKIEELALRCAQAHQGWVPLPGKFLRAVVQQRALAVRSSEGTLLAACVQAREGVPWLVAEDQSSGWQLLQHVGQHTVRVDASAPWHASPPAITLRELGPWWCSDDTWLADLPASVLSCLD